MKNILEILSTDLAFMIYEIILVGMLFFLNIKLRKRNKNKLEQLSLQRDKTREDDLDAALRNNLYEEGQVKATKSNKPYEIDFHENIEKQNRSEHEISVQIEEIGNLSKRKYVVNVQDELSIGRGLDNGIVISDMNIGKRQCRLLNMERSLCIQRTEANIPMTLLRKKKRYTLNQDIVKLNDGDSLAVGQTTLVFHFISVG